jgi:hypothetical protein
MASLTLADIASRTVPAGAKPMAKKKWIAKATSNAHGQFAAKAKAAGKTTREFAAEKSDAPGRLGKQARLAQTLMGMHHQKERHDRWYGK